MTLTLGVARSRGCCKELSPGSISIHLPPLCSSVMASFPCGTPVCTLPGVVQGWSQQYLKPVDGHWGAELPPLENEVLDLLSQEKPSNNPPPLYPAPPVSALFIFLDFLCHMGQRQDIRHPWLWPLCHKGTLSSLSDTTGSL